MSGTGASSRRQRIDRLRFRCTACDRSPMVAEEEALRCVGCGQRTPIRDGRPWFVEPGEFHQDDPLDRIKSPLKRFPRLYALAIATISPLYFDGTRRRFLRDRVRDRDGVILNLGSGNTDHGEAVVHVDVAPYDRVDLVGDITHLPLADDSVDGVMSISVLEHVADPAAVLAEVRRVLRPGGWVYTDVPFVVGYHASPADFHRWTDQGVRELHRDFEEERLVINGGPTSALLWIFQEWLAILLSFGSRRLHALVYIALMLLTFPFKFLDLLLKRLPTARQIASCFIYIGRKPEPPR